MASDSVSQAVGLKILETASEMRTFSREMRKAGKRIGFVPTMVRDRCGGCGPDGRGGKPLQNRISASPTLQGYLHEGHLSLVRAARAECDAVVASIYVNPTQFSINEDFGRYPRNFERDVELLTAEGCAAVFTPKSLYKQARAGDDGLVVGAAKSGDVDDGHSTWVTVEGLTEGLCSASRPTFFRGVTTVVTKLFNIVEPDCAFFGKKDYQQWRILERVTRDLDFDIKIVGMPIEREADGLALSSRNVLLQPEHRKAAPVIYAALTAVRNAVQAGKSVSVEAAREEIVEKIAASGAAVDYVSVIDALTLVPLDPSISLSERPRMTLIAIAAMYGRVRLIDNLEIEPVTL